MNQPPYGSYGAPGVAPSQDSAAQKVSLPATLMMVFAALALIWGVVSILLNVLGAGLGVAAGSGDQAMNQIFSGAIGIVSAAVSLLFNGVVLFGAYKMKKLESHSLAVVSAALFALPCSFCCLINLPVGIWALITLLDQNVKAAFRS